MLLEYSKNSKLKNSKSWVHYCYWQPQNINSSYKSSHDQEPFALDAAELEGVEALMATVQNAGEKVQ